VTATSGFVWIDCDAYLFDIDGTLLNSRDGVHYHAFHAALRQVYGIEERIDGVHVHGNTDIGILRAVVERAGKAEWFEARLPAALEVMRSEVARNQKELHPELCPGVRELLESLARERKILGVVSGNLEEIGWLKLRAAGIRDRFAFGSFSDQNEFREQIFRHSSALAATHFAETGLAPSRASGTQPRVCFVGDTPFDIAAAKKLGLPIIALATGVYSRDQLLAHGPDLCLGCCAELLPYGGAAQAGSKAG
jgi:phosphoglycolate phosphatase